MMPAPTAKCSICGETVLKAQTRHIGDGKRACKTHDGVMGIAEEVHSSQLAAIASKREADERKRRERRHHDEPISMELHCHICNRPAVKVSDMMMEMLVTSKEMELEGTAGGGLLSMMLDGDTALAERVRAKFEGKVGLYVYTDEELGDQWERVLRRVRRGLRDGCRMFGFAGICLECVKELGLPDKMANLPQPSMETLYILGNSVDKALTKIVEKRRNEQNNDQRTDV